MDELDVEEVAVPTASKRSPVVMAVIGLVMFAVGGGAGYAGSTMMGGGADAAEVSDEAAADDLEPGSTGAARVVHNLGRFTVNLRGSGGGRILRTEVQVELLDSGLAQVEAQEAVLRDAVISLASDYTYADLEGLDGKMRLRDELFARLNAVVEGPRIERVFFTEFVVQ